VARLEQPMMENEESEPDVPERCCSTSTFDDVVVAASELESHGTS
jgi:hypothetical protein